MFVTGLSVRLFLQRKKDSKAFQDYLNDSQCYNSIISSQHSYVWSGRISGLQGYPFKAYSAQETHSRGKKSYKQMDT